MHPEFWLERWSQGRIGFHQTNVEPLLHQHWPKLGLDTGKRVFVPLCGKSRDLLWLVDRGHEVTGVELSEIAIEAFLTENGVLSRRHVLGDFDRYDAHRLTLFRGDFFCLTPAVVSNVAMIYDRAALISWAPDLRDAYVQHLTTIVPRGTSIFLIAVEYSQSQTAGPPFSVDYDEVSRLFARQFDMRVLERRDVLAREPRLRSRGVTALFEVCYHLVRSFDR